ncbi:MAG: hypothetical protein ACXVYL_06225 [Oryzihumus sp.]
MTPRFRRLIVLVALAVLVATAVVGALVHGPHAHDGAAATSWGAPAPSS